MTIRIFEKISLDDGDFRKLKNVTPTANNSRYLSLEQGRKIELEVRRIESQTSPNKDQKYESFNSQTVKYY